MYGDHAQVRIISDLSTALPAAALSRRHMPGRWQVVDYEIAGLAGRLLSAGIETGAPPIEIPLDARGWHAIYIGFWAPRWVEPTEVRLKLSSDVNYVRWRPEQPDNLKIFERFWKYANIHEGDALQIAQQVQGRMAPAGVAFIKLVPLSEAEVAAVQQDRSTTENRHLIAMNDAFSDFNRYRPETASDIQEWIEPFRDTDVGKLLWCVGAGGDVVTYNSRVGNVIGQDTADFPRVGDRYLAESMRILMSKGIDPLRVACDYTQSLGIEFHVSQRMEAFACSPPFEEFFTGWTYLQHPEWHCVDRDGASVVRLSYAFDGVQRMVLDLFHEVASYGVDGINPIFNRGAPFVLYEEPLVQGFHSEFGQDPRELEERDERWLRYRANTMTDFMRRLRQEMDAVAKTPTGKRLQVTAHVLNNAENNLFYALDLDTWIEEDLVDGLVAYPWRGDSTEDIDIEYFAGLCNGRAVEWYVEMMPRQMSPAAYLERARRIYAAGATGLCLWDTNGRAPLWQQWAIAQRLGHRDELDRLAPDDNGAVDHQVLTVGGYRLDRYPPHWTY